MKVYFKFHCFQPRACTPLKVRLQVGDFCIWIEIQKLFPPHHCDSLVCCISASDYQLAVHYKQSLNPRLTEDCIKLLIGLQVPKLFLFKYLDFCKWEILILNCFIFPQWVKRQLKLFFWETMGIAENVWVILNKI